ncbi:MAG: shikimate dehydrogenase family protein [Bacteroidales bacterium]
MQAHNILAVFGNPILHSKSPQLFNSAINKSGIQAFYTRIRPQSAKDIIEIIRNLPLLGANITAPFKEDIMKLVSIASLDAETIGAVNTIVNSGDRLIGYNTDHYGVTQTLNEAGINLANTKCLVLGAGGAARAAVYGLVKHGAQVYICNRTHAKAKAIANDFACKVIDWDSFSTSIEFDVVISTLLPNVLPPFFNKLSFHHLLDASYKQSKISEASKQKAVNVISGERWLLHQAAEAFKLMLNNLPDLKAMSAGLTNNLNSNNIKIKEIPKTSRDEIVSVQPQLLISTKGLNSNQIKSISDEEISKAFGS